MGADLDRVDWSRLEHNYGDAGDLPALLRACADRDETVAAAALDEVDNKLHHQGGWVCPAAVAAVPFLVGLAETATHHRAEVVELIWLLAREGATVDAEHVAAGWPAALDGVRARLLALLADPDPRVRRAATLVAGDGLRHPDAAGALRERLVVERDPATRLDIVLAMGAAAAWHESLRAELVPLLDHEDPQLRLAAVHALGASAAVARVADLVRAVVAPEAVRWQDSAWIGGTRATLVHATGSFLHGDTVAATTFALGVHGGGEPLAGLREAALVLGEWRSATAAILPFLAEQLDHDEAAIRYEAAYLLACAGTEAAGHADRLATLANDPAPYDSQRETTVGDAAVWALARLGDRRCVPGLVDRLTGDRLGFDTYSHHFSGSVHLAWLPSVREVLAPLRAHAAVLVDAVVTRLADDDPALRRNLCEVIADWGPAAEAAAPALLPRRDPAVAMAIGAIGSATHAKALRREADMPEAAWALWRTGAGPDALLRHLTRHPYRDGGDHRTIRLAADLGPLAAATTGRLRELCRARDDWTRVEAAHALWRTTGDPTEAVPALTDLVRPLRDGDALPVRFAAMRYLADMGARTDAVLAVARAVDANPRRIASFAGWRAFAEDENLRASVRDLLG